MNGAFEGVKKYLLPNEEIRLVSNIRSGVLVLSSRRIVILNEKGPPMNNIEVTIPYDCVLIIESKKADRFEVSGKILDQYGQDTGETTSFEIRASKGEVKSHFESTMKECSEIVDEFRSSAITSPDLSYLEEMPESLTRNAVLDLNTILRDQPVHDALVHEAVKFLGNEPFLLEESLRDGSNKEDGVLFAAGKKGYYWIRGRKHGRFMSNVIVDTVEWENLRCLAHQWHRENAIVYATYSLTKGGNETTTEYLWSPTPNSDTNKYPWLLQQLNGPLILADVRSRCTGIPPSKSSRLD